MNTQLKLKRKVPLDFLGVNAALAVLTLIISFIEVASAATGSGTELTDITDPCAADRASARAFPEMPASLKCAPAPEPYMVDENGNKTLISPSIIKDKAAAIALGKALFWDNQVGSDGLACASCHFHAGADNRIKNQINPGSRNASGEFASDGVTPINNVFNFMSSNPNTGFWDALAAASGKGPNYTLKKEDFPFRKYLEPEDLIEGQPLQSDRNAEVVYDSDDIVSSQGVYHSIYNGLAPKGRKEDCEKSFPTSGPDAPLFNVAGYSIRQVEPRNTPTVINAVYYFRNFWDGRANNVFNGLDPFGLRRFADPDTTPEGDIYIKTRNGTLTPKRIAIHNASLASQAVGPALSDFEMSCGGKSFVELGRKMLTRRPLSNQKVDPTDSVLGPYAKPGVGLKPKYTYKYLIQKAFNNAYWDVPDTRKVGGYKLIENNFSLFWGLAVQAYESTLVSNDSRFDQAQEDYINGRNGSDRLTEQEQNGLNLFFGKGQCIACHSGPELTNASVTHVSNPDNDAEIGKYVERMVMGDGGIALYDSGFYNIGVRPSKEDLGVGAGDPYGFPLSFARNAKRNAYDPWDDTIENPNVSSLSPDPIQTNSFLFLASLDPVVSDEREAVDGAFKVPSLRNVELTGPYFHNGGQASLEQVIQFYNRGGDRKDLFQKDPDCGGALINSDGLVSPDPETGLIDSSGFFSFEGEGQTSNIAADMAGTKELLDTTCYPQGQSPDNTLKLSSSEVDDIVAFLKTLTDERVRWEKAPFDHPSLTLPNGQIGDENWVKYKSSTNQAMQQTLLLPAVGAAGREAKGLPPIQSFDSGLQ